MNETGSKFEDIPALLTQILMELKKISNGPGVDATPFEKPEPAEQPREEEHTGVTHEEVKALCLKMNRKDPANKREIKKLIQKYTDGKLADISNADLPKIKADIEALNA